MVNRLHHLDALRAVAMLTVVVWHLTAAWPAVQALSPSTMFVIQWPMALSRCMLPLFFMLAGFFGALLLAREGPVKFAQGRLLRIGVPLLVAALVTVIPLTFLIINQWPPTADARSDDLMHLWFLYYVLLFYAGVLALPHLPGVARLRQGLVALLGSALAVPVLAAFTTVLIFAVHQLPPTPAAWWFPRPPVVVFYGAFFALGALVQGSSGGMDLVGRRLGLNAVLAIAALVPTVLLRIGPISTGPEFLSPTAEGYLWMAAFCLLAWASTFAVCGLGRRWLTRERPAVRYMADSSYWIYLIHPPLMLILLVLITSLDLPFPVAWLLVVTLLFAILLGLYELVVRHSVVGRVLNGPRPPRGWSLWGWRRAGRNRVPKGASG